MAEDQTPVSKAAGGRRWVKPLLIVSLAINLAVAGLVLGAVFGEKGVRRGGDVMPAGGMRPYLSALPESKRPLVRQKLLENRDSLRASREQLRGASRSIRTAIGTEPFEVEMLKQAFAEQRALYDGLAAGSHNALADIIASMSPAERAEFLSSLSEYRRNFRPENGKPPKKN